MVKFLTMIIAVFLINGCSKDKENISNMTLKNNLIYPMELSVDGKHIFGGEANEKGVIPDNTNVPLHKLLTIDLEDPDCPIRVKGISKLPLYYPLKYGAGGSSVQYKVISENEIKIIYLSDLVPDGEGDAYVKVKYFPELSYRLKNPIKNDNAVDWFTITLGGKETLDHTPDTCLNPKCSMYKKEPDVYLIASIPPVPIPGYDEIWWEFEGAYMLFYFWYCKSCNSVIASNRAT